MRERFLWYLASYYGTSRGKRTNRTGNYLPTPPLLGYSLVNGNWAGLRSGEFAEGWYEHLRTSCVLLLAFALGVSAAFSQAVIATIVGSVKDASGAVIANAKITPGNRSAADLCYRSELGPRREPHADHAGSPRHRVLQQRRQADRLRKGHLNGDRHPRRQHQRFHQRHGHH